MVIARDFDRKNDELRPITIQRAVTEIPGSVIYTCGLTKVFVSALVQESVPAWREASGKGWLTASYEMLPGSTPRRKPREMVPDGRSQEIKRLIGRSLRSAVDLSLLGSRTVHIDCHVLYADAGTRTTCINAGYIALSDAISDLIKRGLLTQSPITRSVEAISVGLVESQARLDLYYLEDSRAEVDLNVVSANGTDLVEVQGTGEKRPFTRAELDKLVETAFRGLEAIHDLHLRTLQNQETPR